MQNNKQPEPYDEDKYLQEQIVRLSSNMKNMRESTEFRQENP